MKVNARNKNGTCGIMLVECLAYIAGLAVVMGLSYGAYYRCVTTSNGMRRNATDITEAMQCGERWREDVRRAEGNLSVTEADERQTMRIPRKSGAIIYVFENGAVKRSMDGKKWDSILINVKASQIKKEERKHVVAWRWELELDSRKDARMRPLFTFQAAQKKK